MKVFLAGATGVIGARLLPKLLAAGHAVTAMTRRQESAARLESAGATPVVCDVYDREWLHRAVAAAGPEVVIHQLTSLPRRIHPRRVPKQLAATNRVRTEGTANLVAAAVGAGARRIVAQSIAFAHRPEREGLKTEADPLFLDPPTRYRPLINAVAELERLTTGTEAIEGVALRYGYFYGPGTIYGPGGSFLEDVRKRRVPIVGRGGGVFSFIDLDDAADATIAALDSPEGIYQIVDDQPAPLREWLPEFARAAGAAPPPRVPRWLGRLVAGWYGIYMMELQRGISNARAKDRLGWQPSQPSWREGFRRLLADRDG